jgi:hypothetical protein
LVAAVFTGTGAAFFAGAALAGAALVGLDFFVALAVGAVVVVELGFAAFTGVFAGALTGVLTGVLAGVALVAPFAGTGLAVLADACLADAALTGAAFLTGTALVGAGLPELFADAVLGAVFAAAFAGAFFAGAADDFAGAAFAAWAGTALAEPFVVPELLVFVALDVALDTVVFFDEAAALVVRGVEDNENLSWS